MGCATSSVILPVSLHSHLRGCSAPAICSGEELILAKLTAKAYQLPHLSDPTTISLSDLPVSVALIGIVTGDDLGQRTPYGLMVKDRLGRIFVALRGTDSWREGVEDAEFCLVDCPIYPGSKVEQGFLDVYLTLKVGQISLHAAVLTASSKGSLVFVGGHSLGAALTTLLALDLLATTGNVVDHLITFGSPRVGDKILVQTLNYRHLIVTRFVTQRHFRDDLVAHLPPWWFGYRHVGKATHLYPKVKNTVVCRHEFDSYLSVLDPGHAPTEDCQQSTDIFS